MSLLIFLRVFPDFVFFKINLKKISSMHLAFLTKPQNKLKIDNNFFFWIQNEFFFKYIRLVQNIFLNNNNSWNKKRNNLSQPSL